MPNNEEVVVSIGSEKYKGTLHVLSLTGGAVRLDKRYASGTLGDIGINTVSGNFSAAIELLQMAKGKAQAFRFIAIGAVARKRLEEALNKYAWTRIRSRELHWTGSEGCHNAFSPVVVGNRRVVA